MKKIKFKCEICAKELSRKDNLQSHKRDVYYRSRKFVCLECKRKFSRKGNLLAHKKSVADVDSVMNSFPLQSLKTIYARKMILSPQQNNLNPMNQLFELH